MTGPAALNISDIGLTRVYSFIVNRCVVFKIRERTPESSMIEGTVWALHKHSWI